MIKKKDLDRIYSNSMKSTICYLSPPLQLFDSIFILDLLWSIKWFYSPVAICIFVNLFNIFVFNGVLIIDFQKSRKFKHLDNFYWAYLSAFSLLELLNYAGFFRDLFCNSFYHKYIYSLVRLKIWTQSIVEQYVLNVIAECRKLECNGPR